MSSEQMLDSYNRDHSMDNATPMECAIRQLAEAVGQQELKYVNNATADVLDESIEEFLKGVGVTYGPQRTIASLGLKIRFLPEDKRQEELDTLNRLIQSYPEQPELSLLLQFTQEIGTILMRFKNPVQFGTFSNIILMHIGDLQNRLQSRKVTSTGHTSFSSN